MEKIDIKSSCLVQMASNGNNKSMSRMDLTPWDLQFLLLDPIQKGILFHKPESQQLRNTIIDHLKNTLSRTLSFFPPLAGRLGTAVVGNGDNNVSYFVDCNNAGAEFTHAVAAEVCVSDISEPNYIPEIVSSFFPLNGVSNIDGISKPLFGVQVTELVDGFFISCTANHAIIDGTSFWHFFNSWSEISRGFDKISKMPLFEKWFPSNCNDGLILLPPLEQNNLLPKRHVMMPQLLQRVFHFSKESVAKLKAKANSEAGSDKIIISSLQVVSAHLWRSIARNKNRNRRTPQINTQEEEVCCIMLFVVGARARIPLGDGYFGNGTYIAKTSISETELLGKGLGYLGMKINEFVASQNREEVVKFVEDWIEKPTIVRKGSIGNCTLAITSSPRHNVYGNDFGWGKPIAVRSGKSQKFDGKMTTFPAAEDGGIDVEVCLAAETMQAMESDAEFLDAFENY
ncbi:hypothetical protein ABFS82_09G039700 [Erythranthe guttata]|uniref:HXXXD-type acyl-transferase family protein n=1 Tax=Erythranthe guttata TaxID=4155 RepID=A0A022R6H4_ERYGU|nr:PREDICTED: uncharacterized acetyltransferase At3g50280-like [Erythranthe guttata]EYU35826.1 hypothetical protein MIMGU_mgv1a006141mg [Erythranthe guttata]|eukprot:XP_012839364.1 PREDICTED: uncharacterized acetyltransferase At3g50280-like [Erythranthe guttata]